MRNTPKTAGNAYIIILVLIALLAALTLTISRMGQTTSGDVSQEQASAIATKLMRQASSMGNAVNGLIAKGCSISQISFENSAVSGYANILSPADKSCRLFDGAGAGMAWPTIPSGANNGSNWVFPRNTSVVGVGIERETGAFCASNCQDLVMVLPRVNLSVCQAINLAAGVRTSYSAAPPQVINSYDLYYKFATTYAGPSVDTYSSADTSTGIQLQAPGAPMRSTALFDKKAGCFEASAGYKDETNTSQSGAGVYMFYQVLYER